MAKVIVPRGYAARFNMPSSSAIHELSPTDFIGRQRNLWRPLGAIAAWRPGTAADVIHTFNCIPIHRSAPWLVTFEAKLPWTLGRGAQAASRLMRFRLAGRSCGRVIAMSKWALGRMIDQHHGWGGLRTLLEKTEVLYPALAPRVTAPRSYEPGKPIRAVFVGHDWATKGAPVLGRLATMTKRSRLPFEAHVVSSLRFGYADDPCRERYEGDRALITDGAVRFHGTLPNEQVHALLDTAHLLFLPSLGDTFGYVVLEAYSHALPAIVSSTNALTEIVENGVSGFHLPLDTDHLNTWVHLKRGWEPINVAYDAMAGGALSIVESLVAGEVDYEALSAGALNRLQSNHNPLTRDARLNALYSSLA